MRIFVIEKMGKSLKLYIVFVLLVLRNELNKCSCNEGMKRNTLKVLGLCNEIITGNETTLFRLLRNDIYYSLNKHEGLDCQ